jgi:hypothetical protein
MIPEHKQHYARLIERLGGEVLGDAPEDIERASHVLAEKLKRSEKVLWHTLRCSLIACNFLLSS